MRLQSVDVNEIEQQVNEDHRGAAQQRSTGQNTTDAAVPRGDAKRLSLVKG